MFDLGNCFTKIYGENDFKEKSKINLGFDGTLDKDMTSVVIASISSCSAFLLSFPKMKIIKTNSTIESVFFYVISERNIEFKRDIHHYQFEFVPMESDEYWQKSKKILYLKLRIKNDSTLQQLLQSVL